jgi:Flp pilus assembly protein TadD
MFRHCCDRLESAACAAVIVALLSGCAVVEAPEGGQRRGASAEAPLAEPSARRYPARVEADGQSGFTVTEVAGISGSARSVYQDALVLLAREDYAGGIPLLTRVTEEAPEVTTPFVDLGIAHARSGDLQAAESSLRAALERTPDHPVANNELGIVYRKTGRFEQARKSYEQALAVQPEFHYARRNLAVLCDLYLADLACAARNYSAYLEVVPDDRDAQIWLADIRTRLGTSE